jgi:hypothetical protein
MEHLSALKDRASSYDELYLKLINIKVKRQPLTPQQLYHSNHPTGGAHP